MLGLKLNHVSKRAPPGVARLSVAVVISHVWDKQALLCHEERFQVSAQSQCRDVIENIYTTDKTMEYLESTMDTRFLKLRETWS